MRVAFYGNICNNLYQIVKALRENSDIDAHLFIEKYDHPQTWPESDDPSLCNNYPSWIHKDQYLIKGDYIKFYFFPWLLHINKELNEFDMIIVSGIGPILANYSNKPVIFYVTGGDLTWVPFPWRTLLLNPVFTLKTNIGTYLIGIRQRSGIHKCSKIITQPFSPFMLALNELHIPKNHISTAYFPLIIDSTKFRRDVHAKSGNSKAVQEITKKFDFVIFHPSRLQIRDKPVMKKTANWKNNGLLFEGFHRFLETCNARNRACLVLIDRLDSPDIRIAREIISNLGMESNVIWLKPPRPSGFTRDEMISIYSISDVVADDFGVGWFGSVVLEACAIECPVIAYIDEEAMQQLYSWHPILSANTPEGIANQLLKLYTNEEFLKQQGRLGRQWIEEFHTPKSASRIYVKQFAKMIGANEPDNI